jgi:hypothetical protein
VLIIGANVVVGDVANAWLCEMGNGGVGWIEDEADLKQGAL